MKNDLLKKLPKMDVLLNKTELSPFLERLPREDVKRIIQMYFDDLREQIIGGKTAELPSEDEMMGQIEKMITDQEQHSLKGVINATGVVLHTNLGRAPLGHEITEQICEVAYGYSNLEYDLEAGKRGSRYQHIEHTLCALTGAESALIVNNNAAALFLILNTFAKNKSVAVSRGELIEIGDSFRLPDMMRESGAKLVEVGMTNKTHPEDYRKAVEDEEVSVLLKVHTSNFKMIGFTESVGIDELSAIGKEKNCRVFYDMGSALLTDHKIPAFAGEVTVQEALKQGAELVCFSGDKLTGSAQAGLIVGKKSLIDCMKKNPLLRVVRIDKLSLASLELSFRILRSADSTARTLPVIRMLSASEEELKEKAVELCEKLQQGNKTLRFEVISCEDETGGGSMPGRKLMGYAVAVSGEKCSFHPEEWERRLRAQQRPIIARISEERLLLSVRTIFENELEAVVRAFQQII